MKTRCFVVAFAIAALLAPVAAQAQGIVRGGQHGAAVGQRAAGPVGAVVGLSLIHISEPTRPY